MYTDDRGHDDGLGLGSETKGLDHRPSSQAEITGRDHRLKLNLCSPGLADKAQTQVLRASLAMGEISPVYSERTEESSLTPSRARIPADERAGPSLVGGSGVPDPMENPCLTARQILSSLRLAPGAVLRRQALLG